MRNELKHIEEIENYLLGNLSFAEKTLFESRMNSDSIFLKEVELQKGLNERIALRGFTTEIQNFHNEWLISETKIIGNSFRAKWILNTILAIFITGISALSIYYFVGENKENISKENKKPITDSKVTKKKKNNYNSSSVGFIPNGPNYNVTSTYAFSPQSKPKTIGQILNSDTINSTGTVENVLSRLQVPFEEIKINTQKDEEFFTKASRSRVVIPAGILQHQDGSKVIGEVTIRYREWRNSAEMAFANIPMTVDENQDNRFNSTGMIEIRAIQNGEELKIGKETFYTIDYNVTEKLDSCYFWSFNDESQKWDKLNLLEYNNKSYSTTKNYGNRYLNPEIKYNDSMIESEYGYGYLYGNVNSSLSDTANLNYKIKLFSKAMNGPKYQITKTDSGYFLPEVPPGFYLAVISADGYQSYTIESVDILKNKYTQLNVKLKPEKIKNHAFYKIRIKKGMERREYNRKIKDLNMGSETSYPNDIPLERKLAKYQFTNNEDGFLVPTMVTEPLMSADLKKELEAANKNYSNLVTGLKCAGFGIYNCDQVRRMTNPVTVRPSFGDMPNEKPIMTNYMVLIDKNLNASFNFYTSQFSYSKDGKNVLLIYSGEKVYSVLENDLKNGKKLPNGNTEFKLTDISSQVQSIEDLKKFLNL